MVKENIGDRVLKRLEQELIDNFALPLESANQSVLPEWNSNEAECLLAIRESRCRSLCMLRRMNTGLRDVAYQLRFRQRGISFG